MLSSKKNDVESDATVNAEQHQQPPSSQTALLLHAPRQAYHVEHTYPTPLLQKESEVLVRTRVIGLNPIDWKAP